MPEQDLAFGGETHRRTGEFCPRRKKPLDQVAPALHEFLESFRPPTQESTMPKPTPMHKDEAMDIAHTAHEMPMERLLEAYGKFHSQVTNTATIPVTLEAIDDLIWAKGEGTFDSGYPEGTADLLHGAMGLVTESGEILDALKKNFYGKRKPYTKANMREECGDVFFYLTLVMASQGISLRDILADNVTKLANRYIEKFEVS